MEKILVALNGRDESWGALAHACSLAKRISARISVLLVVESKAAPLEGSTPIESRSRLELLMAAAEAEGIAISFFITEGRYEDEVINFVHANKITLFIHETTEKMTRAANREPAAALRRLRNKIPCRMEVVVQKNI